MIRFCLQQRRRPVRCEPWQRRKALWAPSCVSHPRLSASISTNSYQQTNWWINLLIDNIIFTTGFCGTIWACHYYFGSEGTPLDPLEFKPFVLKSKEQVSSTSAIFTLEPKYKAGENPPKVPQWNHVWRRGVWSVQFKQPQLQIARAYTPLPPLSSEDHPSPGRDDRLWFLIRGEQNGEVSSYLHRLPEGLTVELRGPNLEYELPDDVGEVLFLAGGTGIAPALQAAFTLFEQRGGSSAGVPRMHIMWANRKREDCAGSVSSTTAAKARPSTLGQWMAKLRREQPMIDWPSDNENTHVLINELMCLEKRYPGKITVEYFVDEEGSFVTKELLGAFFREHNQPSNEKSPYALAQETAQEAARLAKNELFNLNGNSTSEEQHMAYLRNKASTEDDPHIQPPLRKLIMISGPDGFVDHFAGAKAWVNGHESQGALGGLLGKIQPTGWDVRKL